MIVRRLPAAGLLAIALLLALVVWSGAARAAPHDVRAHVAAFFPDDPGRGTTPGRWQAVQWNFAGPFGVGAPDAWQHLIDAGRPGGRGVTVAVLDTGVAYANRPPWKRSPDLAPQRFVAGYDFVDHDARPDDRNGHGTHVASTVAETTNNGLGLTGLAYGARIMPVRVLDAGGGGYASTIARGVRWAASHGAKIINMSLELPSGTTRADIPELIDAIAYAHRRGALVVAAAGNQGASRVAYPARDDLVLSVGSTTEHGCASSFSDTGPGLDLVAPGGGDDATLAGDPRCNPAGPAGRDISQMTLTDSSYHHFGIPSGYDGTSMAAAHVSAIAALIVASGAIGPDPSPRAIERRLEQTAMDLGPPGFDAHYGWGLANAAAATAPGPPVRPVAPAASGP